MILVGLPWLCNPTEIRQESISIAKEEKVDAIAVVIGVGYVEKFWVAGVSPVGIAGGAGSREI